MEQSDMVSLLRDIRYGVYDSHLKDIAVAVFMRRDEIQGTDSFATAAKKYSRGGYQNPTEGRGHLVSVPTPPAVTVDLPSKSVHHHKWRHSTGSIVYKGLYFHKYELYGKSFEVPANYKDIDLRGHIMRIMDIGTKRLSVRWDQSTSIKTTRYSLRKHAQAQTPFLVGIDVLDDVLIY